MAALDPKRIAPALIQQLDALTQHANARAGTTRDELAKREIVAVRPAANARLAANQLDNSLRQLEDAGDGQLHVGTIPTDRACWFEIGCRSGYETPRGTPSTSPSIGSEWLPASSRQRSAPRRVSYPADGDMRSATPTGSVGAQCQRPTRGRRPTKLTSGRVSAHRSHSGSQRQPMA